MKILKGYEVMEEKGTEIRHLHLEVAEENDSANETVFFVFCFGLYFCLVSKSKSFSDFLLLINWNTGL